VAQVTLIIFWRELEKYFCDSLDVPVSLAV